MSGTEIVCFIAMAILCNTVLPVPFDPVLIAFASSQSNVDAIAIALTAAVCAGLGAAAEITLFRRFHDRAPEKWLSLIPRWKGRRIYLAAFLFALLPLPFSVVRLAALREPPRIMPYQASVTLGRAPRYLLTILLWPTLGLPRGSGLVLLALAVTCGMIGWLRQPSRRVSG